MNDNEQNSLCCQVCGHETDEPTVQHIFTKCSVAKTHNEILTSTIMNTDSIAQVLTNGVWYTTHDKKQPKFTNALWSLKQGDLGYIPAK